MDGGDFNQTYTEIVECADDILGAIKDVLETAKDKYQQNSSPEIDYNPDPPQDNYPPDVIYEDTSDYDRDIEIDVVYNNYNNEDDDEDKDD